MQKLCCLSFLKKDLFDVDHFLKSLLNLLQYYFCFMFFVFYFFLSHWYLRS